MKVHALNWNKIGNIPMNSRSFGIFTITVVLFLPRRVDLRTGIGKLVGSALQLCGQV